MIKTNTWSMAANLHVYLRDEDRDRFNRFAKDEKLSLATAVKRVMLKELDRKGY